MTNGKNNRLGPILTSLALAGLCVWIPLQLVDFPQKNYHHLIYPSSFETFDRGPTRSEIALLVVFGLGAAGFLLMAIRMVKMRPRKLVTTEVYKYLDQIQEPEGEYCLLLRPFGNDGFLNLRFAYSNNRLTFLWSTLNAAGEMTVESIVSKSVKSSAGIECVSVVDPSLSYLPGGPKYLFIKPDDWKIGVDCLLKRAHSIVIYIPEDEHIRKSLVWEIFSAIRVGLIGRMFILLSPFSYNSRRAAVEELRQNCSTWLPALANLEGDICGIYITDLEHATVYHVKQKSSKFKDTVSHHSYQEMIDTVFSEIRQQLDPIPFGGRYPYRFDDYDDSTSGLTDHQKRSHLVVLKGSSYE